MSFIPGPGRLKNQKRAVVARGGTRTVFVLCFVLFLFVLFSGLKTTQEPPQTPRPPRSHPRPRESVVNCFHADRTFSRPADQGQSYAHAVCGRVALAGSRQVLCWLPPYSRSLPGASQEDPISAHHGASLEHLRCMHACCLRSMEHCVAFCHNRMLPP